MTSRSTESRQSATDGRPSFVGRPSLVERAYETIRRRILDNEYQPAQQVLEQDLAFDLGMSRTPVREALVRLQNEGFIQLVSRHGMRVVPQSVSDLRDLYEVLTALEVAALERVIASAPGDGVLAPLDRAVDDMDRALDLADIDGWAKGDEVFHRGLVALSGNGRLTTIAFSLWEQGHRARRMTVRLRASLKQSNLEHRAVLEAVRRADVTAACREHRAHRARTSSEIARLLEQTRL